MATSSFKKEFIIKDQKVARRFEADVASSSSTVSYEKKDANVQKEKEDKLLERLVSA